VTISEIKVESTSRSEPEKVERYGGGSEFKRTDDVGKLDETLQIGTGTTPTALDKTATISDGNTASFELGQFKDSNGNNIDMSGQDITIIIVFDDGTEERYSFTT
jgi:hypothetical protein